METNNRHSNWPRERPVTRVMSILLGSFFIVGIPVSFVIYPNDRIEWASASALKLALMVAVSLVCAAVGLIFIMIGVIGHAPSWFQRCAQKKRQPIRD
jgi:hypothetical protein